MISLFNQRWFFIPLLKSLRVEVCRIVVVASQQSFQIDNSYACGGNYLVLRTSRKSQFLVDQVHLFYDEWLIEEEEKTKQKHMVV